MGLSKCPHRQVPISPLVLWGKRKVTSYHFSVEADTSNFLLSISDVQRADSATWALAEPHVSLLRTWEKGTLACSPPGALLGLKKSVSDPHTQLAILALGAAISHDTKVFTK